LKNLVLAGVRATLCDIRPKSTEASPSFFVRNDANESNDDTTTNKDDETDMNKKKRKLNDDTKVSTVPTDTADMTIGQSLQEPVEELNPLLGSCRILHRKVSEIDKELLLQFDIVVASRLGMEESSQLSRLAREVGTKCYIVDCFGWDAVCVIDLGPNYKYRAELGKNQVSSDFRPLYNSSEEQYNTSPPLLEELWSIPFTDLTTRVDRHHPPIPWMQYRAILEYHAQTQTWPSSDQASHVADILQAWIKVEAPSYETLECFQSDSLCRLAQIATAEMPPVSAVMGGILGNEIIKAITQKGEPANNALIFEGMLGKCRNLLLKPKK
jgi:ubiquitin-like 1-activating enzyme E1 A